MPRLQAIGFMLSTSVKGVIKAEFEQDELVVVVVLDHLMDLLKLLKAHPICRYEQLMDLCGVDYPQRAQRFDVVYNLLSVSLNQRIRVVVQTDERTAVPSVRGLWKSADWWERECYDMYGVLFSGQPDLRRILTDYGFDGHPLRKDFPLTGYVEVRYDADQNKVVYEPVTLTQDMRDFDFDSPWEGLVTLPGDEKVHERRQNIKPYSL
ncbi:NADH-quinone oxidoreductase subunit C [Commensalibacter oyaizuii]|uniref:NADH-quinone oxidoreductase subunit C n=1 Tax=Commensalibacter oyaizuii TaxID=3043873 RepID=A0ABT6PZU2_9PROT|nr:NADH-quinone oxidoreductase subunit C [Commensalibacter sp. TBRC 16381]MDI2090382.1 NADH-quinone oxidoreductase subunit C [Commensalibacter sp. TBRC 16381]